MLRFAIIFVVIAIVSAIFGFGNLAGTASNIAQLMFFVFGALFIVSVIIGRRRSVE